MCELLAMSSRWPADVSVSLEELASHGGRKGPHRDGWGIAYFAGRDVMRVREPRAASESACIQFVAAQHLASECVVGHIRRATRGDRILANTQPFARELGGRMHVFAHNGDLPDVFTDPRIRIARFHPIGDTDSERAFCALLERIQQLGDDAEIPPLAARVQVVVDFARMLRTLGPAANFLYADGDALFVHAHRRRHAPGEPLAPPGLHLLCRTCRQEPGIVSTPALRVRATQQHQRVLLAASVPLTDEAWDPLGEGEVVVLRGGEVHERVAG